MPTLKTQWLFYAISSGACAALNGVFAKLTTTHLTTSWAKSLSHFFGLKDESIIFEGLVRGVRPLALSKKIATVPLGCPLLLTLDKSM